MTDFGSPRWHNYDIPCRLSRILAVPLRIDRNINLMAVGELATKEPGTDNMLYVNASIWIGGGVVKSGAQLAVRQSTASRAKG